jgi:hypothetical protein
MTLKRILRLPKYLNGTIQLLLNPLGDASAKVRA